MMRLRQRFWIMPFAAMAMSGAAHADDYRVITTGGAVEGVAGPTTGSAVFKGIPYAAPPTGSLRWMPPEAAPPWKGVRSADKFANDCVSIQPSTESQAPGQSEDCLYLNVWAPAHKASSRLPVMVWIYGGAFVGGSPTYARYGGEGLNKKGVLLVTFGFRTGVFGFLAHPGLTAESGHHASGNYGLLDAAAALKWVRSNIARFGGDPSRVTLFGQSSGSQMVNLLTVSPLGKGLFQRVIGESGAGFGEREPKPLAQAEQAGASYAAAFGGTIAALRQADAKTLLAGAKRGQFEPVVDGWVLPENPHTLLARGLQNDVPTLVGSNADEAQLMPTMTRARYEEQVRAYYAGQADRVLARFAVPDDGAAPAMAKRFGSLVLGDYNVGSWAHGQSRTGRSSVYQYRFTHVPPPSTAPLPAGMVGPRGAAHGAEVIYAFNNLAAQPRAWTDTDRQVADQVSSYWTNFARTGNPDGPGLPHWPSLREAPTRIMEIGDETRVIARPNVPDLDFVESVFYGAGGVFAPK